MPSAKKRNFNSKPASLEVINRHNQHKKETWHDVKRSLPPQKEK